MRVLLFGASGQVGTEIRRKAARTGGDASLTLILPDRAEADFTRPEALAALVATAAEAGATGIVNAAAYTAVDRAESEEDLATAINATAPAAIARAAAATGLPLVHLSTDYVFPGTEPEPRRESDPTGPVSAYGRSKLLGEQQVLESGARAAILRTAWVFAAHGRNFVRTMLHLGRTRPRLSVVSDQHGGPTPAEALAEAALTVLQHLTARQRAEDQGLFHFTGQPATDWASFAAEILARAGLTTPIERIPTSGYPTPARRPAWSLLDCSRILAIHGLAQPDWRPALDRVLAELNAPDLKTEQPAP